MVGHWRLLGKLKARCDRPGIEETSFCVGISCRQFGSFWVMAFSSVMGLSPDKGLITRFLIMWLCVIGLGPCMVVVEKAYGIWSDSSISKS